MRKIFQWFMYSSANPQALSLTLRAGVPLLVFFGVDEVFATDIANTIVEVIVKTGELLLLLVTVYGFIRKLVLSLKG